MSLPLGQSLCCDNLRRGFITSGQLSQWVNQGDVSAATWDPASVYRAVAGSVDYDPALTGLAAQGVGDGGELLETLAIEDVQQAADVLHPVYVRSQRRHGHVSLDVSPFLARDTTGAIREALRLHRAVGRDNLMIRLPATPEGIAAVDPLVSRGISVNVGWIFSLDVHAAVLDAYLRGLEMWVRAGGDPAVISCVASFSISRIDAAIDHEISMALDSTRDRQTRARLKGLLGKIGDASATLVCANLREGSESDRWSTLVASGAKPQQLQWMAAGGGRATRPAILQDGSARVVEEGEVAVARSREQLEELAGLGISLADVTDTLLEETISESSDTFGKLLAALESKSQALATREFGQTRYELGDDHIEASVSRTLDTWRHEGSVGRLWAHDEWLWTGGTEANWLGWLSAIESQREQSMRLRHLVHDVTGAGFEHVVLLGARGLNLCSKLLRDSFGPIAGYPELLVLDSVDPVLFPTHVRAIEDAIDPTRTLFVVSSGSGDTAGTDAPIHYFLEKVREKLGEEAGSRFLAITHANSPLHRLAKSERFDHIFLGDPSTRDRYSALSNFAMVPAALMGIDVAEFLDRAQIMAASCAPCVPVEANPGAVLGVIIARIAQAGRDKLTLVTSPGIAALGEWLEQLVSDSIGIGKGIVAVVGEALGPPSGYANDRLFVYAKLATDSCDEIDVALDDLEAAGHPVVRVSIDEALDLGRLLFQWMFATAIAGAVLKLDPFDSLDVESGPCTLDPTREFTRNRKP